MTSYKKLVIEIEEIVFDKEMTDGTKITELWNLLLEKGVTREKVGE